MWRNQIRSLFAILMSMFVAACTSADSAVPDAAVNKVVTNYEECVAAGYPIMKTLPPRCVAPGGLVFFKEESLPLKDGPVKEGKICKDLCGDGECQEIVCLGSGCPCS